jgi:DNA-binding transcriptional MerR regulator
MTGEDRVDGDGWTVGRLAAATGLSVRVLRHWDEIGVVSPARTAAGHRRYGPAEIIRLYRALALRRTGLRLEQVGALLGDADPDPAATLRAHLAELEDDLRERTRLRDRLREALAAGAAGTTPLMRVIETMTMVDGYVHGYRLREGERLRDQAATLAELLHADSGYPPGSRVLEVGCGVGAQTVELLRRSPGARITSLDRSRPSLAEARRRVGAVAGGDAVTFLEAEVDDLPHAEGPLAAARFDHVFVCFLLEHLPDPAGALRRLREMVVPGGTLTLVEGDHDSAAFHPDSAAARHAIDCLVRLQARAGGDALIGPRLAGLAAGAGLVGTTERACEVIVDADTGPAALVEGFVRDTFTAMIAGVREPAIAAGLATADEFDAGVADLLATARPGGRFRYTFTRVTARRPG